MHTTVGVVLLTKIGAAPRCLHLRARPRRRARECVAHGLRRHRAVRRLHSLQTIRRSDAGWRTDNARLLLGALAASILRYRSGWPSPDRPLGARTDRGV